MAGLARGDLAEHDGGRDADALLPSGLAHRVEPGTVEEATEDVGHGLLDDARTVVLHRHLVLVLLDALDADIDLRKDLRLLAGVQGVVHRLLDAHDQRFHLRIEAEDLPVLLEELGDGYLLLLLGQLFSDRTHGIDLGYTG